MILLAGNNPAPVGVSYDLITVFPLPMKPPYSLRLYNSISTFAFCR